MAEGHLFHSHVTREKGSKFLVRPRDDFLGIMCISNEAYLLFVYSTVMLVEFPCKKIVMMLAENFGLFGNHSQLCTSDIFEVKECEDVDDDCG